MPRRKRSVIEPVPDGYQYCSRCKTIREVLDFSRVAPSGAQASKQFATCLTCRYPLLPPLLLRPLSCLLLIYGPKKRQLLFLGLAAIVLPLKASSTARVAAALRIYRSSRGPCRTEMLPAQATVAVLTVLNEYRLSNPVPQRVVPPANRVEDDPDEPQDDPDNDPAIVRGLHGPLPLGYRSQIYYIRPLDLGRMDLECPYCEALHWKGERENGSTLRNPVFTKCCLRGEVQPPPVREPPYELSRLYTENTPEAREFRRNIRHYNGALCFTSINVKSDNRTAGQHGPVQIQGQLIHLQGPLLANEGEQPKYAQLWFHDPAAANIARCASDKVLNKSILQKLDGILRCVLLAPSLHLEVLEGNDRRRYNLPTAGEVAAVFPRPDLGPEDNTLNFRDVVLRLRRSEVGLGLTKINPAHSAYIPLQYPLLFPTVMVVGSGVCSCRI
ncbi:hypothetical protein EYZ11_012937 [Aspergillus tanneri]|uniref:Helitron helicase-like domain-containing protein n=1 Tax=Aspergillus tanneri TaxID=1220188 RepID=A0A4S3IYX9_9EURO|nr:hypothetical protein EYZ11_012937 [Aspergillus tanneri]